MKKIIAIIAFATLSAFLTGCEEKKSKGEQAATSTTETDSTFVDSLAQKEMSPMFGRSLELDTKIGEQIDKILESIEGDESKLTAEHKKFFKQVGYEYSEAGPGYYGTIGDGCSWYCGGGPSKISASSHLKSKDAAITYLPENAHDFSLKTAWVEGVKGYGIGEYLVYHFEPLTARITKVIVANGYVKTEKAYRENSRVKKLKMYIDNKPFAILNFEDKRLEQIFNFEPIGNLGKSQTLKFEILEVYEGEKYDDTAISEIYFDGIDVHCFGKGTKILMADNSLKNIELIREGEFVKSYDFKNKRLIDSKVAKLISVTHSNLLKLKFSDNEIITTADHPFWVDKNVWAAADAGKANKDYFHKTKVEKLNVGDKIFIPDKNIFSEILAIENINTQQTTYTIELSENDSFIANGMLVKTEVVK